MIKKRSRTGKWRIEQRNGIFIAALRLDSTSATDVLLAACARLLAQSKRYIAARCTFGRKLVPKLPIQTRPKCSRLTASISLSLSPPPHSRLHVRSIERHHERQCSRPPFFSFSFFTCTLISQRNIFGCRLRESHPLSLRYASSILGSDDSQSIQRFGLFALSFALLREKSMLCKSLIMMLGRCRKEIQRGI